MRPGWEAITANYFQVIPMLDVETISIEDQSPKNDVSMCIFFKSAAACSVDGFFFFFFCCPYSANFWLIFIALLLLS